MLNLHLEGRPKSLLLALSLCPRTDEDPRKDGERARVRGTGELVWGSVQDLLMSIVGSMTGSLHEDSSGASPYSMRPMPLGHGCRPT